LAASGCRRSAATSASGVPSAIGSLWRQASRLARNCACALVVVPCCAGLEEFAGTRLHYVGDQATAVRFYRDAPELGNFTERQYVENFDRAFPQLHFRANIADDLDKFSGPYRAMRPTLTKAFADLNDILPHLLYLKLPGQQIAQQFSASSSFSISPESPQTHRDLKAMRERDVIFGKVTVRCEWHLKIQPDRDRIHFHFGVAGTGGGKILIGKLCYHLK
jgi:hypothetical protein